MSAEDREMANILARENRRDRFQAVMNFIKPSVSSILDLGCGIGSLTLLLTERFPSASIVGLEESKYLLDELNSKMKTNILVVRADAPIFPLKPKSFDVVVAVQVLHEVFYFKGERELLATINNVYNLLQEGGAFIILDHRNPGEAPILVRLSKELLEKLHYFKLKFRPRKISYKTLDEGWIRMNMRDFYDFVTKIWAMGTNLEEEEMHETHTPFTEHEFSKLCQKAGFKTKHIESITSIDSHLKSYKIDVKTDSRLPERHFIVDVEK